MTDGSIETRVRMLEDRAAIHDMLALIARAIDRYDGAALAILIDPEAVIDMGGTEPITGAVFAAQIKRPAAPRPGRMHVISNVLVTLDDDSAASESQITSWQDQLVEGERVTRVRAGRYLDRFARGSKGWRLTARTMVDEWSRIDPVDKLAPQGRHLGLPAPDDLLYGHFNGGRG